jgi:hypothetical protein
MANEDRPDQAPETDGMPSRRNMLRVSALGMAAIATVRPGTAQAAASLMTCTIPVPDPGNSTKWIRYDGELVAKNSLLAYPGPSQPLNGTDVQNAIKYGTNYPGYGYLQSSAYTNYIKKLTQGKAGFTCFASVQNPSN